MVVTPVFATLMLLLVGRGVLSLTPIPPSLIDVSLQLTAALMPYGSPFTCWRARWGRAAGSHASSFASP